MGALSKGEHKSLIHKEHNLVAVKYLDLKEKQLISSCATTLQGKPRVKISRMGEKVTRVDDLVYCIMELGLTDDKDDRKRLGFLITCGGSKVKEVYVLNKEVSDYQHARNVVDAKMEVRKNQT